MLMRMYIRWAEIYHNFKVEVVEKLEGESVGIKSAMIKIVGEKAYGWAKSESGIHRLVRISPFDANGKRHTSFASVGVTPVIEDSIDIAVDEKDLKIDTYRASGAGGQHVNKTESAVRITHIPTGVVVQCQNGRSQHRNKDEALKLLKGRLYQIELEKKEQKMAEEYGKKCDIGWGNQIRSYVMHPYQMVKDLRTGHEVGNINSVFDGIEDINVDAVNRHNGHTPLHLACANGSTGVVNLLLKREDIDVNAINEDGYTPLDLACKKDKAEVVTSLLKRKDINVNADENGCTPLHYAAEDGHKEAIDILMAKGADPLLKNKDGKTPMDLDKNGYIKQFLEKKAIKNGIIAGCATAALSTAIAVTLFATGTVAVELMSMMIAAAIITTAALAVGGITYSILKPSTKMDETKEAQNVNRDGNVLGDGRQ
ncbi:peptide chain release factor 2 [Trichonephila clavata]|uniref:Peptide chain release factor 2 n=2 Tax=Trichonephila clavata TaxID=2740835 RepID=A0A8X6G2R4_TRICU|nr:peptide chain release factor 2 [Trichonephila clavata]